MQTYNRQHRGCEHVIITIIIIPVIVVNDYYSFIIIAIVSAPGLSRIAIDRVNVNHINNNISEECFVSYAKVNCRNARCIPHQRPTSSPKAPLTSRLWR